MDDWSCLIGEFASGSTGVWEGTTLAKGYDRQGFGHEWAEINGSEGSAVYRLHEPNTILLGKSGQDLAPVEVPAEYLKPAGQPAQPRGGSPATVFRYDLMWEFIAAIVESRPAVPSFYDGLNAQLVADAVLESTRAAHLDRHPAGAGLNGLCRAGVLACCKVGLDRLLSTG